MVIQSGGNCIQAENVGLGREVRAEYVGGEFIFLEVSLWPSE